MTDASIMCYRKDVRLPTQMQRAMAAEAEATREAKAKVSTHRIRRACEQILCRISELNRPKKLMACLLRYFCWYKTCLP